MIDASCEWFDVYNNFQEFSYWFGAALEAGGSISLKEKVYNHLLKKKRPLIFVFAKIVKNCTEAVKKGCIIFTFSTKHCDEKHIEALGEVVKCSAKNLEQNISSQKTPNIYAFEVEGGNQLVRNFRDDGSLTKIVASLIL